MRFGCVPCHLTLCRVPRTAKPSRRGLQTQATPFKSHREYLKTRRGRSQIHRHIAHLLQPIHPASAALALPASSRECPKTQHSCARAQRQCKATNRSPRGALPNPAPHRLTLRRPLRNTAEPQALPGTRRTFQEPPGRAACMERARECLASAKQAERCRGSQAQCLRGAARRCYSRRPPIANFWSR